MKNVMKSIAVFFLMTLLVVTVQSQAIDIVNTKHDNLFVLRVDKELMGAQVEVLSADGNRVTAQRLKKRKMIIDFCDVKSGLYTIVVSKNDQQQKFEFVRK
jgi:cytochrome oxidase Cu insertion factor (SCO1/SenC/PrrC family)